MIIDMMFLDYGDSSFKLQCNDYYFFLQ